MVWIFSRTGRRRSLWLPCWFVRHGPDEKGGWNWRGFKRLVFSSPRKLRWNLKIAPWKRRITYKPALLVFQPFGFGGVLCFFLWKRNMQQNQLTWIFGFHMLLCENTQIPCVRATALIPTHEDPSGNICEHGVLHEEHAIQQWWVVRNPWKGWLIEGNLLQPCLHCLLGFPDLYQFPTITNQHSGLR